MQFQDAFDDIFALFSPEPIRIFSAASIDYPHDQVLDYYEERRSWMTLLHDYEALYLHTQDLFIDLLFSYAIITTTILTTPQAKGFDQLHAKNDIEVRPRRLFGTLSIHFVQPSRP